MKKYSKMEPLDELMESVYTTSYDVGSEHPADVTHINDPHSFFMRPTAYNQYLNLLHAYDGRLAQSKVLLGSIIVYKSSTLKMAVRGRIMYISKDFEGNVVTADILAIDYGCYDKSVPLRRLYQRIHERDIPPLAVHCQLADCHPKGETWELRVNEFMGYFASKGPTKMRVRAIIEELLVVEVTNSCPDDIAQMLIYMELAVLVNGENMVNRFNTLEPQRLNYRFPSLVLGQTLRVRVQSGNSLKSFYVAEVAAYKRYLHERANLTQFTRGQSPIEADNVIEGMPVSVLLIAQNKFERAIVRKVNSALHKAELQLVDWGRLLEAPFAHMYAITEQFCTQPVTAIYCSAEEGQAWNNGLPKFLSPGYEFEMSVLRVGDGFETPNFVTLNMVK